ncbi:choice-of-anchor D domain-containing protein [Saccharicrinis sp. GN24d3]|uniref:choice-of-anchor D domain-containing protein n=1 Tax=Saccharicrinis sp. GN24d3 TaxID=3458416 RepID=UPI00403644EB
MKKHYLALCIVGALLLILAPVKGQYVEFVQITDDTRDQKIPAIDGDYVVYEHYPFGGGVEIYLYNRVTKTEKLLTPGPATLRMNPDISGNRVVWSEKVDDEWDWDIFIYDINTPHIDPRPLLVWEGGQRKPAIHGDILVFVDYKMDVDYGNVYAYDFATGVLTRLTHDVEQGQTNPDVFGDYVVWEDFRSGDWDIYMYHIPTGTETQLTDHPASQQRPAIYDKRIVWMDYRNGDWDIYMHHITHGIGSVFENFDWPLWNLGQYNREDQKYPAIYGDRVVWQDDRNGDWDLYMFTFINPIAGNFTRMFDVDHDQTMPAIFDKYVVFEDERDNDGAKDIWQWEVPPGCDLSLVVEDEPDPVVTGNELTYTVYIKNTGQQTANNVLVTCTLSSSVDYVRSYNSHGTGSTIVGNEVLCSLGTMEYNDLDTIEVVVTPLDEGRPIFTALVETIDNDINLENNFQSIRTDVVWALSDVIDVGMSPSLYMHNNASHIVYTDKEEGDYLRYATNKSGAWSRSTVYENDDDPIFYPHVAVDQNDTVHVVYYEYIYTNWLSPYELYYVRQTASGWSTPLKLADSSSDFGGVNINCSPEGIVYVSYLKTQWGDNINLHYFNGTWNGPLVLPTLPSRSAYNDLAMSVDNNGHIHFAYYLMGAANQGPHYMTNAPDSIWKTSELIQDNWGGGQLETLRLSIATDNGNRPHICYSASHEGDYEENYMYAVKTSGSWSNDFVYAQQWSSFSAIATDPLQDPHICFKDQISGRLIYSFESGGNWVHKTITNDGSSINGIKSDDDGYVHIAFSEYNSSYGKNVLKYLTSRPEPPKPQISVSPDSIDFWKRIVGQITDPRVVTIRNYGDADLVIANASIDYTIEQDFYITDNPCTTIPADGKCEISVAFDPQSIGNKTEYLRIESNDLVYPVIRIKLKGEGLEPIAIVNGDSQFGEVTVGSSLSHPFEIINEGNTDLRVDLVVIQDDDADQFSFDGLPDGAFYINPGESQAFNVYFSPTTVGDKITRLLVYTSDLDYRNIYLTGTGVVPWYPISGSVKAPDNSPITQGVVIVDVMKDNGDLDFFIREELFGSDLFSLNAPEGTVTLFIHPDEDVYPELMRGYYGNAATLADATMINHNQEIIGLELFALNAPGNAGGSSQVDGSLENEDSPQAYPTGLKSVLASKVEGAAVYLYDQSGTIIAYDVTDVNGEFSFTNIPAGTFTFYVDHFGIPMGNATQVEEVVIDADGQVMVIEAKIVNGVITATVSEITGVSSLFDKAELKVYPNPAKSVLYIDAPMFKDEVVVQIINAAGQVVWHKNIQPNIGGLRTSISVDFLENGVYLLQVIGYGESYQTKVVVRN